MHHILLHKNDEIWKTNDVCMFSNTTLTYKCWLETGTGMHIGLETKCISIWLMLGVLYMWCMWHMWYVLMLMYCECYVHFFNVLKLMSYDNEDVWMMLYNLMKKCEYVVYDVMPIYILFMHPYICYNEYSHPFVVVVYYGVCTLGVHKLKTRSSSCEMFRRWRRRYTFVAII
jgi:hypothetical protein